MVISELIKAHQQMRSSTLNLIVSENLMSPATLTALSTDIACRYTNPHKEYRGTLYIDKIMESTEELACRLFGCGDADVRPISGHSAALSALLWAHGKTIMRVSPEDGGYPGYGPQGASDALGIKLVDLPFNHDTGKVDTAAAADSIRGHKPAVVILGASLFCFPYDIAPLVDAARDAGARVFYDGSHVLGLIAGGEFQEPLADGVDALFGSTHKTFPGPQGGIIVSNDFRELSDQVQYRTVDNAHYNRIAALGIAMEEMLPLAADYAKKVVENSRHMARCLHESGVAVKYSGIGFTQSHQVLLESRPLDKVGGPDGFSARLEDAGIITDRLCRLGTAEGTGRGMGMADFEEAASLICEVFNGTAPEDVRPRVEALARAHPVQKYGTV
jgi:glycine hydroxymethyltransferase